MFVMSATMINTWYGVRNEGVRMRLAEALILRADCQKRFEQTKQRIVLNAKVQEGDEPAEDPGSLLGEMESIAAQVLDLMRRINATNSVTAFDENKSISDALAERDVIMLRREVYSDLAKVASIAQTRVSRSEIKYKSTVSVPEVQSNVDALSKSYRELDSRIQELNWKTDLID